MLFVFDIVNFCVGCLFYEVSVILEDGGFVEVLFGMYVLM